MKTHLDVPHIADLLQIANITKDHPNLKPILDEVMLILSQIADDTRKKQADRAKTEQAVVDSGAKAADEDDTPPLKPTPTGGRK